MKRCFKEIQSDLLTPIHLYKVLGRVGSSILESAYNEKEGKMSFVGLHPTGLFKAHGTHIEITTQGTTETFEGDPYKALKVFASGRKAFGCISYDAVRLKEQLPSRHERKKVPDFFFRIYQTVVIFNHEKNSILYSHEGSLEELDRIIAKSFEPIVFQPFQSEKKIAFTTDLEKEEYEKRVEAAQESIRSGEIFQVVLSRVLKASVTASPFAIYRALRQTSPAPYHFFFEEKEFALAGASPELLVSCKGGMLESMPIAGTASKKTARLDLLQDPKETSEHTMLVDLARNDLGILSSRGSVQVKEYMEVKTFSHIHHIVSRIVGMLDPMFTPFDALKIALPAGTLSGAPKIRAMEIIDALEESRRGFYGGAVVLIEENGDVMSSIAIRMAYIEGSQVEVRVGAGIVLDSIPEKEFQETSLKAQGVLEALELAEGGIV